MLESIYTSLTALTTFSRNLTVIGNNVANLNSPGFKASQLSFSELVYRNAVPQGSDGSGGELQFGSGVGGGGTRVLFKQGTLQQTGQDTDVALDGGGFFILRDSKGNTTYTRDGRFEFDAAGFLISKTTGARVAAFDGAVKDLSISTLRTTPPRPTSIVRLTGNLSLGDVASTTTPPSSNGPDGIHDISFTVFDAAGGSHALTLHFVNTSTSADPRHWQFEVRDSTGTPISTGDLRFDVDFTPAAGFNTSSFTLTTLGVPPTQITLDFGATGSFSGVTDFALGASSTATVSSQDGFAAGSLTRVAFGADGTLTISYSNGQTGTGPKLAVAVFDSPEELSLAGTGMFENLTAQKVILGNPGSGGFGTLKPQSLETANVDLAQQFSELIVSQRGYQASSQVITTANDMIQQLLDIEAKR